MSPSTMKTGARKKGRREESVSGGETEKWVKLSVDPPLHFSSSLWSLPDMCFYFWFFFFFFFLLTLHVFKKKNYSQYLVSSCLRSIFAGGHLGRVLREESLFLAQKHRGPARVSEYEAPLFSSATGL